MESINLHRLPRSVSPQRYDVRLRPDIKAATFTGSVSIVATVNEPTELIVMNSIELTITSARVQQSGSEIDSTVSLDEDTERLTLSLGAPLAVGDVEIELSFDGTLNDKLRGFYRSTFTGEDGVEHTIATTQFESTNARRCFPCWDEPDRKAIFRVSLEVPEQMLAVSAMGETARTVVAGGLVRIDFAPTPLMSTYLLAFVVGDLEASPPIDVDGVPVRIIHRPGRGDEIRFAHDAAVFCLRWLTDYFGVSYFGDKIDLLAIPDFAFGAMENTGCITFREVLLLVDPDATTQPEQQRSVAVIAHELAHMWFGNLVTMQWWEGLWLKEAFATFMETAATDAYRPDWQVWDGFALERSSAYEVDALHSTRAIEYEVESPDDAEAMYDVLTYEKGASVVRMLEQYVGPERFRNGIRSYMQTHAFGNTVTSDLWNAIGSACDLPVDEIMNEWIYQGGFPLVDASISDGQLVLDQQPFTLLERPLGDERSWNIPLSVSVDGSDDRVLMVPQGRMQLGQPDPSIIVDPHNHGFFRVRYDDALSQHLTSRLMELTPGQRYSLFDDMFDLVLAGKKSVPDYISLAKALRDETSPPVWTSLSSGFATLAHVATDRQHAGTVGALWSSVARPQLDALGYDRATDDEGPLVNEVRASLFGSLGSLSRDPEVIDLARALFDGTTASSNTSIESAALRVIASTGDRSDYDEIFRRFQGAASPQLERRYLFALARFDDAEAIEDLCHRSLDGSVRSQDAAFLLSIALGNRWHGNAVWAYVTANWDRIVEALPANAIGHLLAGVRWLEHGDVDEVQAFIAAHPVPQAGLALAQHLEKLSVHVGLKQRLEAELAAAAPGGHGQQ